MVCAGIEFADRDAAIIGETACALSRDQLHLHTAEKVPVAKLRVDEHNNQVAPEWGSGVAPGSAGHAGRAGCYFACKGDRRLIDVLNVAFGSLTALQYRLVVPFVVRRGVVSQ